jgi:uncharacterized protein YcaQ
MLASRAWTGTGHLRRTHHPRVSTIVWDRRRFETLWGWAYRFEAYTPVPKRKLGYYALPLLWRDRVIGWSNVSIKGGKLRPDVGYVASRPPRDRAYRRAVDEELDRVRDFLGLTS